ncbi:hypothetical protein NQ315_002679 [Exocentrus adspersus]|uniref:Myb-like domain-containing protein n=1 Tax=Exocentrus adspersus TaxID=1586481 RepID=A0AAV8VHU3_9CUCU|nr:hypothetical protein NQ315_002679 [Exocentrus adspersus]
MSDLSEFLVFPTEGASTPSTSNTSRASTSNNSRTVDFKWSVMETKLLIDLYEQYKKKVGTLEIKTIKQMWQRISEKLSEILNTIVTPANCENRWRVLDRNYKKYVDDQKSTGQSRKYFEYAQEMERLFGNKKSIHPPILLNSENIHVPEPETIQENEENMTVEASTSGVTEKEPAKNQNKKIPLHVHKSNPRKRKVTPLENIRQERHSYHNKRLEIEREKVQELKRRNDLLKERNNILKEYQCNCATNLL